MHGWSSIVALSVEQVKVERFEIRKCFDMHSYEGTVWAGSVLCVCVCVCMCVSGDCWNFRRGLFPLRPLIEFVFVDSHVFVGQ